jgi:hypothetical protein
MVVHMLVPTLAFGDELDRLRPMDPNTSSPEPTRSRDDLAALTALRPSEPSRSSACGGWPTAWKATGSSELAEVDAAGAAGRRPVGGWPVTQRRPGSWSPATPTTPVARATWPPGSRPPRPCCPRPWAAPQPTPGGRPGQPPVHCVEGGPADLDNLALLCRAHYRAIHEGGWQLTRGPDGHFTATPPQQPHRHPRPIGDLPPPPEPAARAGYRSPPRRRSPPTVQAT